MRLLRVQVRFFYLWLLMLMACAPSVIQAQPEYYGCHYFKRKIPRRPVPTEHERSLMNESIARSDTFDILHYVIHLDVTDYAGKSIRAAAKVAFTPKMAEQSFIRFDLLNLLVDSVTTDDGVLAYHYDGEILRIDFSTPPAIGSVQEVTVHYHGVPQRDQVWGGFYFESSYIYNLGIGISTVPPNFGKVWYPCFDSFVERATYEYHVKSAGNRRAICQGIFLGEQILSGDTIIRSYSLDQPIPTHISAVAVADYSTHQILHQGLYGEVEVTLAAKPSDLNTMTAKFADIGAAIDACEYWYGPQPFDRVGYVHTTDGALEIPTNIAYPQFMNSQPISANRALFSHELGHHWWGDNVVMREHTDMWMKEGPAEYSSHLMTEWLLGREAFVDQVKNNLLYVLEEAHVEDEGFHPLSGIPEEWIYGVHTYNKGAAVIHNLRGYLGDELFRQGMSGVQQHYNWQDLTAEEFRDALEEQTGRDLNAFFDAWIFQPGYSVFVIDSMRPVQNGVNMDVTVFIQQKLREAFAMHQQVPLDLTLIGPEWERRDYQIMASGEFSQVLVSAPFIPVMAILNGHQRLNQARMDFESVLYPDESFSASIPFVDFRVYDEQIADSTLLRVEHIWAAPDNENLGEGVFELSPSHYWQVDGIWPQGTLFEGRAYYQASEETDLDAALFGTTEADAVLAYRQSSADPWEVYPDYTWSPGSLSNGSGHFHIDVLRKGQYAFANGNPAVGLPETGSQVADIRLFPVPADDYLNVAISSEGRQSVVIDVYDMNGQRVMQSGITLEKNGERKLNTSELASGSYILRVRGRDGGEMFKSTFQILH